MKEGIHPEYNDARAHCICGNEIQTRSTNKEIAVEVCSKCHPFYTGTQRLVDTAGKIDKFRKRYGKTSS